MDKDVARTYSVGNEIFGFVRGARQEMEIGEGFNAPTRRKSHFLPSPVSWRALS